MRHLLYTTLLDVFDGDDDLQGADAAPRIYSAGALGVADTPPLPHKPFMMMREMPRVQYPDVRRTSNAARRTFQLYCYDSHGSYVRIDTLLKTAMVAVEALEGVQSPSGAWCIGAEWTGVSQDFTDEQYDAICKFATIELSANQ